MTPQQCYFSTLLALDSYIKSQGAVVDWKSGNIYSLNLEWRGVIDYSQKFKVYVVRYIPTIVDLDDYADYLDLQYLLEREKASINISQ